MSSGVPNNVKLAWSIAAALLAGCLVIGYLWIDRSITLSYLYVSMRSTGEARDQATMLLAHEWRDRRADDVFAGLQRIKQQIRGSEVFLKRESAEGIIYFGQLRFRFENDRLVEVK